MVAAAEGQTAAIRLLLGRRADLNARSYRGTTALAAAEGTNKHVAAQLLRGAGASSGGAAIRTSGSVGATIKIEGVGLDWCGSACDISVGFEPINDAARRTSHLMQGFV